MRSLLIAVALSLCVASQTRAASQPETSDTLPPKAREQLRRANEFLSHHQFDEATQAFSEANKLSGGKCFSCLEAMAATHIHLKQYDDAITNSREALRIAASKQEQARADNQLGLAWGGKANKDEKNSQELKEAENAFRAALRVDRTFNAPRLNLARVLIREGRDKEGDSTIADYLKREPAGPQADQARALAADHRRATELLAPDFKLTALDGRTFTLDTLKGRVVLLDFWATWCGPCHQALPELKAIQRKYEKEPFQIISVSVDSDRRALEAFVKKNNMTWPQLFDADYRVTRGAFGVNEFPSYLVLDPEGVVVYYIRGYAPKTAAYLTAHIDDALKKAAAKKATSG